MEILVWGNGLSTPESRVNCKVFVCVAYVPICGTDTCTCDTDCTHCDDACVSDCGPAIFCGRREC